jgi:hypothetical protein
MAVVKCVPTLNWRSNMNLKINEQELEILRRLDGLCNKKEI